MDQLNFQYRVIVGLLWSAQAKPLFTEEVSINITPAEIKNWLVAYLDGFDIDQYANTTLDCKREGNILYDLTAASFNNYIHSEYYSGSLNLTDALGELSPLSRVCYETVTELSTAFEQYRAHFGDFKDFMSKVSVNFMSNIKPIRKKGTEIATEFLTTKNYTNVAFLAGEITSLTFVLDAEDYQTPLTSSLKYTEADPLAPNPINDLLWIIFEGLYKFGVNSQLASKARIQSCQNNSLNMILLDTKAWDLWKKGDTKNAWFTFTDSLTLSHEILDQCYHMGQEVVTTVRNIQEHGQIKQNLLHNLFFVLSGLMGTWSQIWYKDWLNLLSVLGGITYRVFVYGSN